MQFVLGIRIVSFVSLLLALILLGICGWTLQQFVTGELGTNSTMRQLQQHHHSPKREVGAEGITSTLDDISDTIKDLKGQWKDFKPFLIGSGGLAIGAGVLQALSSLLILCAGPKGARNRSGCFKCTHFFLLCILIVALMIPAVFDVQHDSLSYRLQDILRRIKEEINTTTFDENFSPNVVTLYYGVIAVDIVGVTLLIVSTCCVMRNADYDYRAY